MAEHGKSCERRDVGEAVQEAIVQLESTHLPDGYHVSLVLLVFNVRANQR